MNHYDKKEKRTLLVYASIFFFLVMGIAISGYVSYYNFEKQFRIQAEHELSAVADLKVKDLVYWRNERRADAELIYGNPAFFKLAARYIRDPQDIAARDEVRTWLGEYEASDQYDRVRLLNAQGDTLISAPEKIPALGYTVMQAIPQALQTRQITLVDFYHDEQDQRVYLSILIPLLDERRPSRVIGFVTLRIDPRVYVYPYLNKWPNESITSETLLVRRDGNDVLFLNEPRFNKYAALTLRFPLTDTGIPAVKAALGHSGVEEGVDYRGEPVLADMHAVPDSPWFLISKMDIVEIYEPLRTRLWQTFGIIGMAIFVAGAGLTSVWRQQRVVFYRAQAESVAALRESEKLLKEAQSIAGLGSYVMDINTGLWISSDVLNRIFGIDDTYQRSVEGWAALIHPEDRAMIVDYFTNEVLGKGMRFNREYRVVRNNDQAVLWVHGLGELEFDSRGHILKMVGTIQDITARKQAAEEILQLNASLEQRVKHRTQELRDAQEKLVRQERLAALGQLAGSVGHELRNPLGVISNAVYFLKVAQPDVSEKIKEYLDIIENETRISAKIVTDLLDFTRIKAMDRQAVSVSELIHQTLERYPAPASVQVTLDLPPDLPLVYVDAYHIVQILGNLTLNAYQAMASIDSITGVPNKGQLTLYASVCDDMIKISIKDTGIGIAPENMHKLFEPLFSTKTTGIGLGLAVSWKLAETNDGRIEVQSEVGKGSTFILWLPVKKW